MILITQRQRAFIVNSDDNNSNRSKAIWIQTSSVVLHCNSCCLETDEKINFGYKSKICCSFMEIEACLL